MNEDPEERASQAATNAQSKDFAAEPLRGDDFYMEGPFMVFTAAYHLRRGYCCNSGCRHCPYK